MDYYLKIDKLYDAYLQKHHEIVMYGRDTHVQEIVIEEQTQRLEEAYEEVVAKLRGELANVANSGDDQIAAANVHHQNDHNGGRDDNANDGTDESLGATSLRNRID